MPLTDAPTLSVVVALISGAKADSRRCLQALHAQTLRVPLEIIVPYDEARADVATLHAEFPTVRFVPAGAPRASTMAAGTRRLHHDTLRTVGIRAATGDVIALTEDHAHTAYTWCEEMVAALERHSQAAAVGGAVECDTPHALNCAVWFCDFGRYQNPLPEGRAAFVSDSNVAYRRAGLTTVARAWEHDYHETVVHEALVAAGFELWTTPRVVVWQARPRLRLGAALRERSVWGRSFAGTRARLIGARRWWLALLCPVLPFVLTWRLARVTFIRKRYRRRFLACVPLILLLQCVWAYGEFVGYVTETPQ